MIVYLLGQLDLDGVEELPINNGRLLARANFRFPEPHSASPDHTNGPLDGQWVYRTLSLPQVWPPSPMDRPEGTSNNVRF